MLDFHQRNLHRRRSYGTPHEYYPHDILYYWFVYCSPSMQVLETWDTGYSIVFSIYTYVLASFGISARVTLFYYYIPSSRSLDTVQFRVFYDLLVSVFTVYFPHQSVLRAEGVLIQTDPTLLLQIFLSCSTHNTVVFHLTFCIFVFGTQHILRSSSTISRPANETVPLGALSGLPVAGKPVNPHWPPSVE